MPKERNNSKKFILKLRDIRREKGMSIHDVAEKAGIDYQKIGRVERGETQVTVDTLYKLSRVLGVPLFKMLQNEEVSDLGESLSENKPNNTDVYIIPCIYNELDKICSKYSIAIENQAKVQLATTVFMVIQDIHTNVKDGEDMVKAFFQGFDAIFERLVLSQEDKDDISQ